MTHLMDESDEMAELQARHDAMLAQIARGRPGIFAQLLQRLRPSEQAQMRERVSNGMAWLRRHEEGGDHGA